jgi:tetratricopeptide (TPR) repeat protein
MPGPCRGRWVCPGFLLLCLAALLPEQLARASLASASLRCSEHMAAPLLVRKAQALLRLDRAADAVACLHLVVGRQPVPHDAAAMLDAWLLLGEAHEAQDEGQQAMLAYGEALRSAAAGSGASGDLGSAQLQAVATARRRRGVLLEMSNEREAALREYELGLQQVAADADLWYNIGYVHLTASDNVLALHCFSTCSRLNSSHALGHEGIGTALFALGHVRAAVFRFSRALELAPSRVLARQNLAAALGKLAMDRDSSYLERALVAYDELLEATPESAEAVAKKVMLKAQLCDWRSLAADVALLVRLTQAQLARGDKPSLSPFQALLLPIPLDLIRRIHERAMLFPAHDLVPRTREGVAVSSAAHAGVGAWGPGAPLVLGGLLQQGGRRPGLGGKPCLCVGFLSADVRNHPGWIARISFLNPKT